MPRLTPEAQAAIDAAGGGEDIPQWTVEMRILRNISVTVEAKTKEEAEEKALQWDIVGDEQPGDTIECEITNIRLDGASR